jgi:hypothetical protein
MISSREVEWRNLLTPVAHPPSHAVTPLHPPCFSRVSVLVKGALADSPLGEDLERAQVNDIVAFNVRNDEIRAQIIDMNHSQG